MNRSAVSLANRAWPILAILLASGGPAGEGRAETAPECEKAKRTNGWCVEGNAGYVAGVEIRSQVLYEALDAHGHDIEPAALTCPTCRKAHKTGGFCPDHRMGFSGGEAYLSLLTYHIARGRPVGTAEVACPVCRGHMQGIGWCDVHRVGIAGWTAIEDPRAFAEFERAYRILLSAVEVSTRCETCAAAMVADGYCAVHRLKYKDGRGDPLTGAP